MTLGQKLILLAFINTDLFKEEKKDYPRFSEINRLRKLRQSLMIEIGL